MKNKILTFSVISLIVSIFLSANAKMNSDEIKAELPPENVQTQGSFAIDENPSKNTSEIRAVWVPFMSLDMKGTDYSEEAFKAKFDNIVSESISHNLNTIIVHVRPFNDALYPSKYFPWSHLLTGEQGKNPGFDPLEYMVKAAHKSGLQFHAWINPLRIQITDRPNTLCETNIYFSLKSTSNAEDIILETETGKYLNPAYPEVRELIINGVKEIVENYSVDGIQFDDYFYPSDDPNLDNISYKEYCCSLLDKSQPISLKDWRFANINSLVSGTYSAIKNINPTVVFGISPSGNLSNNSKIGADVATWCKIPGYIDYICPQIYFSPEHPILPSSTAVNQWMNLPRSDKVKLYFGLAMYKAGSPTADFGTWKDHDDILKTQIEQCRKLGCNGFIFFSFEDFKNENANTEIQNVMSVLN